MSSVNAIEIKVGNIIEYKNSMYRVVSTEHVKPGKGGAFIQAELKDIRNGTKLNERFRSDQILDKVSFETKKVKYLYSEGNELNFMDNETFDQITVQNFVLSGPIEFLADDMELTMDCANEQIVSVNLPQKVKVKIKEVPPYIKNATKTSKFKTAELENGLKVLVPEFIENGEEIIVSTDTLEYVERAK